MQFDSFEKVFSRMFQQICCNFYHFKDTKGQNYVVVFYFESDNIYNIFIKYIVFYYEIHLKYCQEMDAYG
jgi:hypothetical protein